MILTMRECEVRKTMREVVLGFWDSECLLIAFHRVGIWEEMCARKALV